MARKPQKPHPLDRLRLIQFFYYKHNQRDIETTLDRCLSLSPCGSIQFSWLLSSDQLRPTTSSFLLTLHALIFMQRRHAGGHCGARRVSVVHDVHLTVWLCLDPVETFTLTVHTRIFTARLDLWFSSSGSVCNAGTSQRAEPPGLEAPCPDVIIYRLQCAVSQWLTNSLLCDRWYSGLFWTLWQILHW